MRHEIGWNDIIAWFATVQPSDAQSGVALRRTTLDGVEVVLLMLDGDQKPIRRADGTAAGMILRAARLGDEAEQAFNGKNLIVIQ
jgi:hypothetical protein